MNKHIRFLYEDSDLSDCSDSIQDFEGDDQRLLKLMQKSRKKKKSSAFSKKQLGRAAGTQAQGSTNSGKSEKRFYDIESTHRRAASQSLIREEDWSDGCMGRQAVSLDFGGSRRSGIRLFKGAQAESVFESQLQGESGCGKTLKVLAAKRVFETQKKAEVAFPTNEGGIIDKLVLLEEVAAKINADREVVRVCQ